MATGNRGGKGKGAKGKGRPSSLDRLPEKLAAAADMIAGEMEKAARKHEAAAEKAAKHAEKLQRAAETVGALDVWIRPGPGSRRPRFTRDEIAQTAIEIADAEGIDAVSMRRIATELDAGTMTLYHYVRTKDELLTLLTDAVMAEVVVPPEEPFPTHWRAALKLIAMRTRDAFRRHGWILDITDDHRLGPNSMRHFDQTLQAVSTLDLPFAEKLDIVFVVDEYTWGYCVQERNNREQDHVFPTSEMLDYIQELMTTGEYPQLEAISETAGLGESWSMVSEQMRDPTRFERNLDRLLDGIEAEITER
jgi:AcrR family transcriptional regulator